MRTTPHPTAGALQRSLLRSPYFRGMPEKAIQEMARAIREESFAKGSVILKEKSKARRLFILFRGAVALSISRGEGELVTEIVKKRGDLLGWSALVPPRKYTATAKALEDSRVLSIEGKDLEKLFQRYPTWGWLFLRKLSTVIAARLHHTRTLLMDTLS